MCGSAHCPEARLGGAVNSCYSATTRATIPFLSQFKLTIASSNWHSANSIRHSPEESGRGDG
jgi:hypothetical protein